MAESIALGYVNAADMDGDDRYEISLLGQRRMARLLPAPLFDPKGVRLRG